jgi:hypothetical protein
MTARGRSLTRVTLALLLCSLCVGEVVAQQFAGRITGRVVERGTNLPLPGVNVLVEGTQLGTVTDLDGRYDVMRVPPGRHTVVISFVGFSTVRVSNVEVATDRTTTVNAELEEATFEGDEVVVVAERPPVVRDRTSTQTDFSRDEIRAAPVEGLRGLLDLTAGINRTPDGNFSIRGGGAHHVQFLVNGVEQLQSSSGVPGYSYLEKANNSWKYDFNPVGVETVEVIAGGFSAEYGNAQSGIVRLVTREGGTRLEGEYRTEYRGPGQYHWGPHLYGPDTPEHQRWGNLEAWRNHPQLRDSSEAVIRRHHAQWMANRSPVYVPSDTIYAANGDVLWLPGQEVHNRLGVYDYTALAYHRHMFGIGGPLSTGETLRFFLSGEVRMTPTRVPTIERIQDYRNVSLTTSFHPSTGHKLRLTNTYQFYLGGIASGADDIRWAGRPARWKYTLVMDSPREETTLTTALNYTFAIDDRSYFEATAAHSYEQYRVYVEPIEARNRQNDDWYIRPGDWDGAFRQIFSLTSLYQQDTRTHFFDMSAGYTRQINRFWNLRTGVQARHWDMFNSAVSGFRINVFMVDTGFGEFYKARPTYAGAYVQNRLEFEGMVANIGLRLDGYNFNTPVPADRFNIFYPGTGAQAVGNPETVASPTHVRLSPRIGLSFPVGETTAFRLHYGHFTAMPQFRHALLRTTWAGWQAHGNAMLEPEQTIQYEVGVQQALDGAHRLDVVGYYNDRVNQVGVVYLRMPTTSILHRPVRAVNETLTTSYDGNAHGASYGVEVSVERYRIENWFYRLSYAFSRTTTGRYGPLVLYSDDPEDPRNRQVVGPRGEILSGNDRPHMIQGFVTYRLGANEGPALFGLRPLQNSYVSVIYSARSGPPYTYLSPLEPQDIIFNRRLPMEERVHVSFERALDLGGTHLTFGMRIDNALNHRTVTPGMSTDFDGLWANYGITRDQWDDYDYHMAWANVPRQIFFNFGARF